MERTANPYWAGTGPHGLILPHHAIKRVRPSHPVAIDLCAGAGGFSLGFEQAGFHVIGAVEIDPYSTMTYLTNLARYGACTLHFENEQRRQAFENAIDREIDRQAAEHHGVATMPTMGSGYISHHPELHGCRHFWMWDVRTLKGEDVLDAIGLERGDVTAVISGPPCQGFSTAGKRDVMDPRNSLVFEVARLITEIQPKTFCLENVPGIRSMRTPEGLPVLDVLCSILAEGGYGHVNALKAMLQGHQERLGAMRRHAPRDRDEEASGPEQCTLF